MDTLGISGKFHFQAQLLFSPAISLTTTKGLEEDSKKGKTTFVVFTIQLGSDLRVPPKFNCFSTIAFC